MTLPVENGSREAMGARTETEEPVGTEHPPLAQGPVADRPQDLEADRAPNPETGPPVILEISVQPEGLMAAPIADPLRGQPGEMAEESLHQIAVLTRVVGHLEVPRRERSSPLIGLPMRDEPGPEAPAHGRTFPRIEVADLLAGTQRPAPGILVLATEIPLRPGGRQGDGILPIKMIRCTGRILLENQTQSPKRKC